jgi:hypothetical protein
MQLNLKAKEDENRTGEMKHSKIKEMEIVATQSKS